MATIQEAINRDTSGYTRQDNPSTPAHQIEEYMLPPRNVIQICSLPNLPGIFPSTNNIIDFHVGGKVPQFRAPLAAPVTSQGSSTTTTAVITATSSGGSTTPGNPPTSKTASITTPIIISGNTFQGTILLAKSFLLYTLAVNNACRVRLYSTSSAQSTDLSRGLGIPIGLGTGQGIISDVEIDSAPTIFQYTNTDGSNGDSPQGNVVYVTITNLSLSNVAITATITYIPLQS
jgi:hypothetical protein